MKRYKPVLKVEAEMQNIEQVKELLPQIATLQEKYDVQLVIHQTSSKDQCLPELP